MKRLNPAQIDLLTQHYLEGKTVYELGAEFGIARQTVSLVLKRNGVQMRMQGLREDQRDEVDQQRGSARRTVLHMPDNWARTSSPPDSQPRLWGRGSGTVPPHD
ncbi:MAG: hypothetical protein FWF43_09450 [Propionibacteriaceae bacterium]|nr:hypothetical protein [Propionibacteriaceae bacterium]